MAVDAAGLAAALGIEVGKADDETDPGIVEAARLLAIAAALVTAYLRDSQDTMGCPAAVRDEAIIRTAGHIQSRRTFGVQDGRFKASGVQVDITPAARSAVRQSGAAALLSPWVRRGA